MRTVRRFVRMAGRLATVAACVAMVACKGLGDITAPTPVETPVAAVELNVEQLTVAEGTTAILQVTARDANAAVIANLQTFWSSSDTTVAKVSASGVVSALKSGTATIAASVGGRSATARITVAARAVASVQISPPTPSLLVGGFVQLTARTFDDAGGTLAGRTIFWSSNAPTTAVVDVNGLVTGIAPGVATITATSEARSAAVGVTVAQVPAASVQVSPPRDTIVLGQTTQLAATVRDSVGALLTGRVVSWNSASAALATVSSTGLVLGVAPGTVTISATAEGRTGTAVIVVLSRPVGAVIVSPTTSSLVVGQTVQLNTQITDGSGNLLTGRPVSFASSNANVAQVSASGVVTATAPGSATITVTSEGKTGSASITVSASPVASIRITPTTASLLVGGTTKLAADALDESFCFFTKQLANLNNDFAFSLFPNEIRILYLLSFLIESEINTSFVLNIKLIKSSAGPVITVVTNAIITIMVKISEVNTPKSYPIFKTTNSINPLVFINAPIVKLSRQF
jgi:uncharacterized protein YjdB